MCVCVFVCVCTNTCVCVYRQIYVKAWVCTLEDLQMTVLIFYLALERGSLVVEHCVNQANWPSSFQDFPISASPFTVGVLSLQVHTKSATYCEYCRSELIFTLGWKIFHLMSLLSNPVSHSQWKDEPCDTANTVSSVVNAVCNIMPKFTKSYDGWAYSWIFWIHQQW